MKTIENFGGWVLAMWPALLAAFGLSLWGLVMYNAPPTVSLDAKHWECVMAVPDGLSTRCTEYVYKGK